MDKKLILETDLQSFFYDRLCLVNQKSESPLANETLFYSSEVLDKFAHSGCFYNIKNGKTEEKILGLKLLKSHHMSGRERQRALRDVGDTSLIVCGFFAESLNNKITDISYYQQLGQTAYSRLNKVAPEFFGIPSFYSQLAESFHILVSLISIVSNEMMGSEQPVPVTLVINQDKKLKAS